MLPWRSSPFAGKSPFSNASDRVRPCTLVGRCRANSQTRNCSWMASRRLSLYWRWRCRSRSRGGRPRILQELRDFIGRLANQNPHWGASKIHAELQKLGFVIGRRSVARYLHRSVRRGAPIRNGGPSCSNVTQHPHNGVDRAATAGGLSGRDLVLAYTLEVGGTMSATKITASSRFNFLNDWKDGASRRG